MEDLKNREIAFNKKLSEIQQKLKAPKGQYNSFGKYNYRSCEDILESVKPFLKDLSLTITDEVINVGDRYYIQATATLTNGEASIRVSALAREAENKKGMDEAQITGSASSYARKYALNGLFAIDDTKDSDFTNKHGNEKKSTDRKSGVASSNKAPLSRKASEAQITLMERLLKQKDINPIKVCQKYNVLGLDKLTMQQASKVIDSLNSK